MPHKYWSRAGLRIWVKLTRIRPSRNKLDPDIAVKKKPDLGTNLDLIFFFIYDINIIGIYHDFIEDPVEVDPDPFPKSREKTGSGFDPRKSTGSLGSATLVPSVHTEHTARHVVTNILISHR